MAAYLGHPHTHDGTHGALHKTLALYCATGVSVAGSLSSDDSRGHASDASCQTKEEKPLFASITHICRRGHVANRQ